MRSIKMMAGMVALMSVRMRALHPRRLRFPRFEDTDWQVPTWSRERLEITRHTKDNEQAASESEVRENRAGCFVECW